jgi:type I pantothenate kinase
VGIAGSVAVGKSTLSASLAATLRPLDVAVVATDGFLRPNEELAAEGLLLQKGFPATYDLDLLVAFLTDLRAGRSGRVPVYSHDTFDRVPGAAVELGDPDVVVVEGVTVLQPEVAAHLDLRVYLDAEEPLVRSWFVERFLGLVAAAEQDEGSFYRRFVGLDPSARRQVADSVWTGINLVNLTEHILPTRAAADVVLVKTTGHAFS